MNFLFILLGVLCGVMIFTQTTINSQLREHAESPYASSLISFLFGTALLLLLTIIIEGHLFPSLETLQSMEWWAYLGGALGIYVVLSAILVFPRIGGVQTVAIPIFGQMLMSLLIDYFGWFAMDKRPLSLINILGLIILVIGIVFTVILPDYLEKKHLATAEKHMKKSGKLFWQILALLSGFCLAIQPAVNGHLGIGISSGIQAALISFLIGTILLIAINVILKQMTSVKMAFQKKAPWWFYMGGFLGALYVFFALVITPEIGTGAFVIFVLIGQMVVSLLIDNYGLLRSRIRKVSYIQIIGLVVMLLGAGIVKLI